MASDVCRRGCYPPACAEIHHQRQMSWCVVRDAQKPAGCSGSSGLSVRLVCLVKPDKPDQLVPPVSLGYPASSGWSELPLGLALRYSYCYAIGEAMITPDVLTEYLLRMMPDASVTVSDRTGTMDHLKVVVISAAFAGKNLLDRHRLIYQALDGPLKDGRIHALELTAKTTDEA